MNTASSIVLTGVVVSAGQWSQDKKLTMKTFVGLGVLALGLAALNETNAEFASQFATLILVAAILMYMIPIAKWLGYAK